MNELPVGWSSVAIGHVCEFYSGSAFPIEMQGRAGQALPFFKVKDISLAWLSGSTTLLETENTLSAEEAKHIKAKILPENSIVFAKIGEALRLNRRALTKGPSLIDNNVMGMRPPEALVEPRYLFWFSTITRFDSEARASVIPSIRKSDVENLKIPLPPRVEQTRIVIKLEELLSDLDAGVAELKTAQKKLQQYRQSLLKAAVEGTLTAAWRDAQQKAGVIIETGAQLLERILTERRTRWETKQLAKFKEQGKAPPKDWQKKYIEPAKPDTTGFPPLPEGWTWASIEQLGDIQLGRQRSPDKLKGISPVRYIRAGNITESGIDFSDVLEMDFSEQEKNVFALQAGDVLLTEASGSAEHVGRPVIWPDVDGIYCFQNTVLRFKPEGLSSEFAFYSFLAMQKLGVFRKLSGGVGINHLSAGKFSKLPIALASREEQTEIVITLARQLETIDLQALAITHSLKQATAQRQNILRAAFSGQLVPQDPNDEPASVLLERIRTERAKNTAEKKTRARKTKDPS